MSSFQRTGNQRQPLEYKKRGWGLKGDKILDTADGNWRETWGRLVMICGQCWDVMGSSGERRTINIIELFSTETFGLSVEK